MTSDAAAWRAACDQAVAGRPAAAQALLATAAGPPGWRQLGLAALAVAANRWPEALAAAERARDLLAGGPDEAEAWRWLGELAWRSDELATAETAYARAVELAGETDADLAAACRGNLALVLKQRGRYAAALGMLDRVRPRLASLGAAFAARLELNRAALLVEVGRWESAREVARRAAEQCAAVGDEGDLARCRWAAAAAAEGLRLYEEALAGYHHAIAGLRAAGQAEEAAAVLVNVGELYRRLGDPRLALETLAEAEPILLARRPAHLATLHLNRAAVYAGLGRYPAALVEIDRAREVFRVLDLRLEAAEAELLRARIEWDGGQVTAARATLAAARATVVAHGAPHEVAVVDLQRAELDLAEGCPGEAEEICWGILGSVPEALADLRWRACRGLLRAARQRGDLAGALGHGLAAIEALEQLTAGVRHGLLRPTFDEAPGHGELFTEVLGLCAELNDAATAFGVLQRGKARALVEALGHAEVPAPVAEEWLAAERQVADELTELLARADGARGTEELYQAWLDELTAARRRLTELHLRLAEEAPADAALRGYGPIVEPARLQALLGPETVLVEMFVGGADLFLLAIAQDGLELLRLAGRMPAVDEVLDRFEAGLSLLCNTPHELLGRVVPQLHLGAEMDLAELYELLLEPLADRLDAARRILIAPHGRLWGVPFAALHDGLEPLLETVEVALVPSADALWRLALREARPASRGLAIGGDEAQLAAVARELDELCGVLDVDRLCGEAAGREAILAVLGEAGLIHYSGHAEFRPENPLFSALRLVTGERLTAADLYRCRLAADLVTLAACETGRHDGVPSAELVGLARAFLHAGAGTVVASLWSAPDLATGHLVRTFYQAWRHRGEPAAALREAQRRVREQTLHPFFWAGFAAIGLPWRTPPASSA